MKKIPYLCKPSWLNRATLTVTSVVAIAAGLVLASAIFAILLVVGVAAGGWLWWKLRSLTRQTSAAAPDIIEGEYTTEPIPPLLENHRPAPRQSSR